MNPLELYDSYEPYYDGRENAVSTGYREPINNPHGEPAQDEGEGVVAPLHKGPSGNRR